MPERIGKINLNLTSYNGIDGYSDGSIEDDMLKIAKNIDIYTNFDDIFEKDSRWPILYHFSPLRENLLKWYPFKENSEILEIGAGCGAITGALARNSKVTCIELSKKRSLINAHRHKSNENINIHVGNFNDIVLDKKYDYITLIGVLEYAGYYTNTHTPHIDFLKRIKNLLRKDGQLIIAIENKYGLKYWAGAKEDHTCIPFDGISGYRNNSKIATFSKPELKHMLWQSGFTGLNFYYPFPDYKLPEAIYSDKRLPKFYELNCEQSNYSEGSVLFDTKMVYEGLINDGMYDFFANSFLITASETMYDNVPCYVKYSVSRKNCFATATIIENEFVRKIPDTHESITFIEGMANNYHILSNQYKNLKICRYTKNIFDNSLLFNFVKGTSLFSILTDVVKCGNKEDFFNSLYLYKSLLLDKNTLELRQTDIITSQFKEIFGEFSLLPFNYINISNIDMNFENIIMNDDDYTIIDYEWVFSFPIPFNYILYRNVKMFYYTLHNIEKFVPLSEIFKFFKFSDEEIISYGRMEVNFEKYVLNYNQAKIYQPHRKLYEFCKAHPKVYIYGAGQLANYISSIFDMYNIEYNGFIVSDGQNKPEKYLSHPVYFLSDIDTTSNDVGVVLGLSNGYWAKIETLLNIKGTQNIFRPYFI